MKRTRFEAPELLLTIAVGAVLLVVARQLLDPKPPLDPELPPPPKQP